MRTILLLLALMFCRDLQAQQKLDTLYANDKKNVALFFPEAIRQAVTGATHFVFTYNREKEQYFGLLQAQPGVESNLLVVTEDGSVFSYILKYSERLPKLNYFIPQSERIGNEMPIKATPEPSKKVKDSTTLRLEYFERFAEHLLKSKRKRLKTKNKKGIKLQLQGLVYNGQETYLIMELSNTSGISFDIDFLKVYRVSGNKKRKASFQQLEIEPIYTYKMPSRIRNSQSFRFVYALPKFVLGDKEKLQLKIQERKGSRKVVLKY
ncbi:DUF4138 domain-containing protein [Sinomicrobium sp. M5D2P9]